MRIREYQLNELAEARKLQKRMAELHIPSPVMSWGYDIKNVNGEIVEKGIGKANSYTRNALNSLAYYVGLAAYALGGTSFGDGILSIKYPDASTNHTLNTNSQQVRYSSKNAIVEVGISGSAESLDSYVVPTSGLTSGTNAVLSSFNAETRILTTIMSRPFVNNTASAIDIVESGMTIEDYNGSVNLMVRDVFAAISVGAGNTLTWTYTTEVAYPNP